MLGCSAAYNVFHAQRAARLAAALRSCRDLRHDRRHLHALHDAPGQRLGFRSDRRHLDRGRRRHRAKLWQPRRIETISIVLYLALGWIGLVAAGPFLAALDARRSSCWRWAGSSIRQASSSISGDRLPYQNAIWHGFVLVPRASTTSPSLGSLLTPERRAPGNQDHPSYVYVPANPHGGTVADTSMTPNNNGLLYAIIGALAGRGRGRRLLPLQDGHGPALAARPLEAAKPAAPVPAPPPVAAPRPSPPPAAPAGPSAAQLNQARSYIADARRFATAGDFTSAEYLAAGADTAVPGFAETAAARREIADDAHRARPARPARPGAPRHRPWRLRDRRSRPRRGRANRRQCAGGDRCPPRPARRPAPGRATRTAARTRGSLVLVTAARAAISLGDFPLGRPRARRGRADRPARAPPSGRPAPTCSDAARAAPATAN